MSIVVYGSINIDLTAYTPELPRMGETLLGNSYLISLGGKGANQAVAASRLNADVYMVGHVGDDTFGRQALISLSEYGVDVSGVNKLTDHRTGLGVISVDDNGENSIVVISGANMYFAHSDVELCRKFLKGAEVLLLQLEVPIEANLLAARAAHHEGVKIIVDPAPVTQMPSDIYQLADIMTPNEIETEMLVGILPSSPMEAAEAADRLRERGVDTVIITLGSAGVFCASGEGNTYIPAFPVDTVDTVAAGDGFVGGLAVAISEGMPIDHALRWGAAVGALCTRRSGAAISMPDRSEVMELVSTSQ